MKPKSKKEKGKRFEALIAREIEKAGLGKATREIGSGSGRRKGDIFSNIPYLIECKNQKQIRILDWIDQAKREAELGNYYKDKWAVVFRDPRTPERNPEIYVITNLWQWFELLKKDQEPLIKEPDRELKYLLEKLKYFTQQVIKRL